MAECSESTGTISAPCVSAASITSCPAQTNVSLLARAMRFFSRMAARVGRRPTIPTTAVTTVSASGQTAASNRASGPPKTLVSMSARRTARSRAAASSVRTASRGRNFRTCASSRSTSMWAVRAATRSPSCSATSNVWRPIEPVAPKIEIVLLIALSYSKQLKTILNLPKSPVQSSCKASHTKGATKVTESNRSRMPPWPGSRLP